MHSFGRLALHSCLKENINSVRERLYFRFEDIKSPKTHRFCPLGQDSLCSFSIATATTAATVFAILRVLDFL